MTASLVEESRKEPQTPPLGFLSQTNNGQRPTACEGAPSKSYLRCIIV